jgi:beta-lactamase regulating signal transducer with metallopeptidase domain
MGIKEFLFGNPEVVQVTIIMCFGCIVWFAAMIAMLKKEKDVEDDKTVLTVEKKSTEHETGHGIQLTYITKRQIMDLTAEQVKGIPESEVEKLPAVMKDMFRRRRNEVLLADRANSSK